MLTQEGARDLAPTTDLDALIAGAAAGAFRLDPDQVARRLFAPAGVCGPSTAPSMPEPNWD